MILFAILLLIAVSTFILDYILMEADHEVAAMLLGSVTVTSFVICLIVLLSVIMHKFEEPSLRVKISTQRAELIYQLENNVDNPLLFQEITDFNTSLAANQKMREGFFTEPFVSSVWEEIEPIEY